MGNLVMKLRFSLRTAIALLTIAALFCYWRSRPDRLAATYSQHIENYDFAAADALLTDRLSQKLYQLRVNSRWIDVNLNIQQPGVRDWFIGRRRG